MSDTTGGSRDRYNHPVVLYAVGLQQARESGDLTRMRELAERARKEGSTDPEIQSALRDLEAEIARLSAGS